MKKYILLIPFMLLAASVHAKELSINIKHTWNTGNGHTEVNTVAGPIDTLNVTPGKDVSTIYVKLLDAEGNIYSCYCVPATYDDHISLITPSLPEGYVLNIYDDKGYVYRTELE